MKRKRLLITAVILCAIGVLTFTGLSYLFASIFIAPVHSAIGAPPADFRYPLDTVSFTTDDGIRIKGWYAPAVKEQGTMILLHGYKANRSQMLDHAEMFRNHGYGVLLYDARGTGESGGDRISVGYFETADLTAAVRFLQEQGVKKIACVGNSQGGATILLAAAKLHGVRCVIAEGAYDTIRHAVDRRFRETLHIPGWLGGSLITLFAERKLGVKADDISPLHEIAKLPCPVFIIAGAQDSKTWAEDTQRLYEAAKEPKQLWLIDGAGHVDLYNARPDEYEKRVLAFLKKYL